MLERVIVISGAVSSGKSTLAEALSRRFGVSRLSTRNLLMARLGLEDADRKRLQDEGDALDRRTNGQWLAQEISKRMDELGADVIVDAVRLQVQIDALRTAFGRRVVHIHLDAPLDELDRRFKRRRASREGEPDTYAEVRANPTEAAIDGLKHDADIVIDTARSTEDDVVVRAASQLRLFGQRRRRLVDVLVGGQYGSEGKGNVVAYLAPEYELLVRVGGPNAGHKVVTDRGQVFTHHHLPSGTRMSEARLLLGPGAVINVEKLLEEIAEVGVDYERLSIDPCAMTISEEDIANEAELVKSIGSTGQGVGYATARRIRERNQDTILARDVQELSPYIRSAQEVLEEHFASGKRVFLEGTQGTGLSLYHGDYPYVTSRDTTATGCLAESGIAPSRVRKVIMVCRTYPIRVQNPANATSGRMAQEINWAEVARRSGKDVRKLRSAERTSTTGRRRRVGEFDWALLRRAAALNGPTDIALTFADYLDSSNEDARRFEQLSEETIRFIEEVERVAAAPVTLISTRFHYRSIIDRRSW